MHEHIKQSNLIERISGQDEIDRSIFAWEVLANTPLHEVDGSVIKAVQAAIVGGNESLSAAKIGAYRDVSRTGAKVGSYSTPDSYLVPGLMNLWVDRFKAMAPIDAHKIFEAIHPFSDGNGRTGRKLLWRQEIELGVEPTLFYAHEKAEYHRLFANSSNNLIAWLLN